jgi:hypothetical protein
VDGGRRRESASASESPSRKGQCSPTSAGPGVRQETGTVPAVRVHHKELMCTPVRGPSLRNEHRTPRWRDNLNEISINGTVCAGRRTAADGQCQVYNCPGQCDPQRREPATLQGRSRAVWVVPSLKLLPQKRSAAAWLWKSSDSDSEWIRDCESELVVGG